MKSRTHPLPFGTWLRAVTFATLLASPAALRADIGYQFVSVGNPGNANDTVTASDGSGLSFGGVSYTYAIGTYDVTLNQYAAFLNAVAQADPYSLYNANMAAELNIEGIIQTGSSGSYSYSVIGSGLRPVTWVSWFDAARMANWMQNGQPTGLGEVAGSTEQGAYTLNGATSGVISKNGGAVVWIPTESEWYKAAYYDPSKGGPGVGGYWTYATRSNTAPGNVVGSGTNQANYFTDQGSNVYAVSQSGSYSSSQNYLTDVGVFGPNSSSAYGTYDQSGDVFQWVDGVQIDGSTRELRGGSWAGHSSQLQSSFRAFQPNPVPEASTFGFRLATVPEPTVTVSLVFAGGLLLARRKRPSAL
ncbi:MAG TPA: SUMF1/EgtB/PvdO family nonheme iron enzyme [Chthoniobacter sp.]|nr:SUMF1/EgtB/PvdO family nonheme iron enzyme [Chthoniobacter sp.]